MRVMILIVLVAWLPGVASAADLLAIEIATGKTRVNGAELPGGYYIDITVRGVGYSSVSLTTPASCVFPLERVAQDAWYLEAVGFSSLQGIWDHGCLEPGEYTVTLVDDQGGADSATVFYDAGPAEPFLGYPSIVAPAQLDVVGLDPAFSWFCQGSCGSLDWDVLVIDVLAETWRHQTTLPTGQTSWVPGPVDPQTSYLFACHSRQAVAGGIQQLASAGNDTFLYEPVYASLNLVDFTSRERVTVQLSRTVAEWTPLTGAVSYDVVEGDLLSLIDSWGDFEVSTTGCLANDVPTLALSYPTDPGPGEGRWLLVRANAPGADSYDSLVSSQPVSRDAELAASASACP